MEGEELTFIEKVKNTLADKLIFDKIKERLGGRIKFMFSGGAALSTTIARFFQAADIKILEGYGLTETSPVLTVNTLGKVKIGTVGTPIPDTEIKIPIALDLETEPLIIICTDDFGNQYEFSVEDN